MTDEEMLSEMDKCKADRQYFVDKYCRIKKDRDKEVKEVWDEIHAEASKHEPSRSSVIQRQMNSILLALPSYLKKP